MRVVAIFGLLLLLFACSYHSTNLQDQYFTSSEVVQTIKNHTLSIATIYSMSQEEWAKRVEKQGLSLPHKPWSVTRWEGNLQEIIPIGATCIDKAGQPIRFLAYIGSATILKESHAITVSHLFSHEENTYGYTIWAFKDGIDHAIECDLLVRGDIEKNWVNDYAVIKLKEDLGLPGLKIAQTPPLAGEKIIFTGTVGGLAYFTRFGRVTNLKWHFNLGEDGKLHLTPIGPVGFLVCYPGGPGDSGGSAKNTRGEIVGIMYCGMEVYAESYILINPTDFLWQFLESAGLKRLGE